MLHRPLVTCIWLVESCIQEWKEAFWLLKKLLLRHECMLCGLAGVPIPLAVFLGVFIYSFWMVTLILLLCEMRSHNSVGKVSNCLLFIGAQKICLNLWISFICLTVRSLLPNREHLWGEADHIGVRCTLTTFWSLSWHYLILFSQCPELFLPIIGLLYVQGNWGPRNLGHFLPSQPLLRLGTGYRSA